MAIIREFYGETPDGENVYAYTMNNNNMSVKIINLGCSIVSLMVPDKDGKLEDVVLGYDNLSGYIDNPQFLGAIIGRNANRIEGSTIEINDKIYKLTSNEGNNQLHGGINGFHKVVWDAKVVVDEETEWLEFYYTSKDGEEGYPGNVAVKVIYSLTDDNSLEIEYFALSDKDTVVNLTNHSYFNLNGHASGDILNHKVKIYGDKFTAINKESLPTGEIRSVKGTPMDFTFEKYVGSEMFSKYDQIIYGNGYDHNFVLKFTGQNLEKAAEVFEENSGRLMEVYTTKPGIQFYTGNYLNISKNGKCGAKYGKNSGLCLETQYFPDSLRHSNFPSPILKEGKTYNHTTIYKFSVR